MKEGWDSLINSIPEGIIILDPQTNSIVQVNEELKKILKVQNNESQEELREKLRSFELKDI